MMKSRKRRLYEQRIYRVQDYIGLHFDQELTLERLAQLSAFSPFHFHRIFKSIAGETLYDYIQRIRIEKACAMLCASDERRIIDIALSCGFSTPSSFSKAFRQHCGQTPSEYRDSRPHDKRKRGTPQSNNGTENSRIGKDSFSPTGYSNSEVTQTNRRKKMEVKIEMLPPCRVAYMRQIGPYGSGNVPVMERLKKWAAAHELFTPSSEILGIAHDDPDLTPAEKCRYDACIIIPEEQRLAGSVNENRLPGGRYALFSVKHTAEDIARAWENIFTEWLPESGYQIDERPIFERYKGVEIEISEICVPVKPL